MSTGGDAGRGDEAMQLDFLVVEALSSPVDGYLWTVEISVDDPALLLAWHRETLSAFVAFANDDAAMDAELPHWFTRGVGETTVESVVDDIVAHLAERSGGPLGVVCLAPNTTAQIVRVASQLVEIGWHPFFQRGMRGIPANEVLLTIATLSKRTTAAAAVELNVSCDGVRQFYE